MIEWLGISHLFELSGTEALAGFLTPLAICAAFFAGFLTFYVFDYFIFERVQLYTCDVIHERLGFEMIRGGIMVYGWLYILPLWGMAAYPDPGFATPWREVWLIGAPALFLVGWGIALRPPLQLSGRGLLLLLHRPRILLRQPVGLDLLRLHRRPVHFTPTPGR